MTIRIFFAEISKYRLRFASEYGCRGFLTAIFNTDLKIHSLVLLLTLKFIKT